MTKQIPDFASFCKYRDKLVDELPVELGSLRQRLEASEENLLNAWALLSSPQQLRWEQKFEAGYEVSAAAQTSRLVMALATKSASPPVRKAA